MDKAIILIAAAVLVVIPAIGFYKIGEALEQIETDKINRHKGKEDRGAN